jgi:inner membrane protein
MDTTVKTVWNKSKSIVKGCIICVLVLLLLIPTSFVQDIIKERQARQMEAVAEVSSKWAGKQNITGPVLVIPYEEMIADTRGGLKPARQIAYFLPAKLDIRANAKPEKRSRGIYQVMLYTADIQVTGSFSPLPLSSMKIDPASVLWNEAYVCLGISDANGLREELSINWNGVTVPLSPLSVRNGAMQDGFIAPVTIDTNLASREISFSTNVQLNGSQQLLFTPVGKETKVELNSTWPDPSFTGVQLPQTSIVKDSGFKATWKSLAHTRKFPQSWTNDTYKLQDAAFGADLFIPVNDYDKTNRSVKYAILCILLTFTAFFLIETANHKSVHPVQYALIGFALVLFYTLLLSFSEYTGFNIAYLIAAVATIGLIAWFVKGLLGSGKLSALLSVVLVLLYTYVFTILQLQDFALLFGSIGLFIALAIVMYFSKKMQW